MKKKSNMYAEAETWSPFKGCRFDCTYCIPSFQKQAKRQKKRCQKCYKYVPHCHEKRLAEIPSTQIVFVGGNADISFCPPAFTRRIIARIVAHSKRKPHKTFYLQSKRPVYFEQFLKELPENVILLTTLETNRDKGYEAVSKAPLPSVRFKQFKALKFPRKVLTVEPILDFDLPTFVNWIRSIRPQYVWLGFNSKPASVQLPEPSEAKVQKLADRLLKAGIEIRGKTLRGVTLPADVRG
ncbi:MAG: radical SAM protein [Planctomycetota bacterium]|nr:radical SAM protein [Planctomycetota bacterium]